MSTNYKNANFLIKLKELKIISKIFLNFFSSRGFHYDLILFGSNWINWFISLLRMLTDPKSIRLLLKPVGEKTKIRQTERPNKKLILKSDWICKCKRDQPVRHQKRFGFVTGANFCWDSEYGYHRGLLLLGHLFKQERLHLQSQSKKDFDNNLKFFQFYLKIGIFLIGSHQWISSSTLVILNSYWMSHFLRLWAKNVWPNFSVSHEIFLNGSIYILNHQNKLIWRCILFWDLIKVGSLIAVKSETLSISSKARTLNGDNTDWVIRVKCKTQTICISEDNNVASFDSTIRHVSALNYFWLLWFFILYKKKEAAVWCKI